MTRIADVAASSRRPPTTRRYRSPWRILIPASALSLAGCAGLTTGSLVQVPAVPMPVVQLPAVVPSTAPLGTGDTTTVTATPQDIYIRIGRAANTCWFGAHGALKPTHVYYAEAQPEHRGGAAEIIIHERDRSSERPWGLKAFRISITGADVQTVVEVQNLKLDEELARELKHEVFRWARGELVCEARPQLVSAQAVVPAPPPPAGKAKRQKR